MAYGVKYRLEFSNVLTYASKVEILKDGYTGSVNAMVGQSEPVVIKWNAKDDIYKSSIIGSVCTLNLFETDDVTYDNFYEFDEREYQVKVSYKDMYNNYQTYWIGWLVVDRFKEQYKSTPFGFSLRAYDGLGTLDNFLAPIYSSPFNEAIGIPNRERIGDILDNLDLGLDIYVQANQMKSPGILTPTYPRRKKIMDDTLITAGRNELISKYDIPTCKKQLESILRQYNCRIFQSFGKWYIVEASNIFARDVKEDIFDTHNGGGTVSGIRSDITSHLDTNKSEEIQTDIYNSDGIYQSSSDLDGLRVVPDQFKNIGGDLIREYIQPLNKARYTFKTSQNGVYHFTRNVGFEYGSYGWITTSYASLTTDDFTQQGRKAIKLVNAPNTGETLMFNSDYVGQTAQSWKRWMTGVSARFSVFIDKNANSLVSLDVQFKVVVSAPPNFYYWDDVNAEWTTTDTTITRTIEIFNNWQEISINITGENFPTGLTNEQIGIQIYNCVYSGTAVEDIYFDNVGVIGRYFKPSGVSSEPDNNRNIPNNYIEFVERTSATNVYSDEKNIDGTYYFATGNPGIIEPYSYRTRDANGNTVFKNNLQNIMNDNRIFQVRYEGTFRNEIKIPLSMHNRIWFDFTNNQDPESCYLDGLEYKVKSAEASIIAHMPNSDDDLSCKFRVTSE